MKKILKKVVLGLIFFSVVSLLIAQPSFITASKPQGGSHFGSSISMDKSGNIVAVGSSGAWKKRNRTGGVYILKRNESGGFTEEAQLFATDGRDGDGFGKTVSIEVNAKCLVVGVLGDDDNGKNSGSVYVFENQGGDWKEVAKLLKPKAEKGGAGELFGSSVSVSEGAEYIIVGAPVQQEYREKKGSVHVYKKEGQEWKHQVALVSSDARFRDRFGSSVSIDTKGNTIVVGAKGYSCAYIFEREGNSWTQKLRFRHAQLSGLGISAAINSNGTIAAIGANKGAVVLEKVNGTWQQRSILFPDYHNDSYGFGAAIAMNSSGQQIVIGAIRAKNEGNRTTGGSFIFSRKGDEWVQQKILFPEDGKSKIFIDNHSNRYGSSMAISANGNLLVIGDPRFAGRTGGYSAGAIFAYNFSSLIK